MQLPDDDKELKLKAIHSVFFYVYLNANASVACFMSTSLLQHNHSIFYFMFQFSLKAITERKKCINVTIATFFPSLYLFMKKKAYAMLLLWAQAKWKYKFKCLIFFFVYLMSISSNFRPNNWKCKLDRHLPTGHKITWTKKSCVLH